MSVEFKEKIKQELLSPSLTLPQEERDNLPEFKATKPEILARSIAVFNLADHESLMTAACITTAASYINQGSMEVTMVDIRDEIPEQFEGIDWCRVGGPDNYIGYHGLNSEKVSSLKDFYLKIKNTSVVFESDLINHHEPWERPAVSAIGKMAKKLYEDGSIGDDLFRFFMAIAGHAVEFHSTNMDADRCCAYYKLLRRAHEMYQSRPGSLVLTPDLLEVSAEELEEFKKSQAFFNKAVSKKIRHMSVRDIQFVQIVDLTQEVYGIIRRLEMSGKNWLHRSIGLYGPVFYSNLKLPKGIGFVDNYLDLS